MRTTLTIDDDLAALLERERQRTGETFREVTNRLLRRGLQRGEREPRNVELPLLPGRPRIDISDTSAVLAAEDDELLRTKGSY
jgi:hypothetical protein